MSSRVVVVGAGGFGRETLDVIASINRDGTNPKFQVVGVLDDAPSDINLKRLNSLGITYLGSIDGWLETGDDALFVVGIGSPGARAAIAHRFELCGLKAATLVHPSVHLGSGVQLGEGAIICGGVNVSTNVRIGNHTQINPNATIGHDAVLHDYVSVNPAATISGDVTVGAAALIGAGAVILQGLEVGDESVVGASACVVRAVPAGATVKGVPAK